MNPTTTPEEEDTPYLVIPRAHETISDEEMSGKGEPAWKNQTINDHAFIIELSHNIRKLKRAQCKPPPPATYHNVPALVEKIPTLTTKVGDLETDNNNQRTSFGNSSTTT